MRNKIKKIIAFVMVLVMILTATNMQIALADDGGVPTTRDELLMRAFFEQTNKDGVKNGVLFAGEKYDPYNVSTWCLDYYEAIGRIAGLDSTGGGYRVPTCTFENGILNKLTNEIYFEFANFINPETGELYGVDGYTEDIRYNGSFQFFNSPETEIQLSSKEIDRFTCWGVKQLDVYFPYATEFNTRINGNQFTICSSVPSGINVSMIVKDFSVSKPYNSHFSPAYSDIYDLFMGWYDRKTGDLFSSEHHLSNSAFSFDDNIVLEARFLGFDLLPKIGDINADGEINSGDASSLLQQLVNSNEFNVWEDFVRYDVNCEGKINTGDAVLILKTVIGR
ncbi:MAG: hypothetical protein GX802_04605 [Clostridiales bacterium]|nr:hypothetical protein [Clostridiales bacterium]